MVIRANEIMKPKRETQITIKMSFDNYWKLKEKILKERLTMREYIHAALGLTLQKEEKKK